MRNNAEIKGHRSASAAVLLVGGGAIAVATWTSGDHGFAIGLAVAYVIFAAIALAWAGGKGDVAAVLRVGWDERQRGLDRDSMALTGLVLEVVAIVGAVVEIARTGTPGPYGLMCVVAGVTYAVCFFLLRRRR